MLIDMIACRQEQPERAMARTETFELCVSNLECENEARRYTNKE